MECEYGPGVDIVLPRQLLRQRSSARRPPRELVLANLHVRQLCGESARECCYDCRQRLSSATYYSLRGTGSLVFQKRNGRYAVGRRLRPAARGAHSVAEPLARRPVQRRGVSRDRGTRVDSIALIAAFTLHPAEGRPVAHPTSTGEPQCPSTAVFGPCLGLRGWARSGACERARRYCHYCAVNGSIYAY